MNNGLNLDISYEEGIKYTANMIKEWIEEDGELTFGQLLDNPIYPVCKELEDDFGDDVEAYIDYVIRRTDFLELDYDQGRILIVDNDQDCEEDESGEAVEYRIYADTAEVSAKDFRNGSYDPMAIIENSTSDPIVITSDKAEAYEAWKTLDDPAVRYMPYTGTYRLEGFWMDEGSEYGMELLEISDFAKAEVL